MEEFPALKKPNTKFSPLDVSVWFPDKDWFADIVSAPDEREMTRGKQRRSRNSIKLLVFENHMTDTNNILPVLGFIEVTFEHDCLPVTTKMTL